MSEDWTAVQNNTRQTDDDNHERAPSVGTRTEQRTEVPPMLCGEELISNAWCSSKEDTLRTVRAFEGNFLLDLLELERDERRVGVAIAGMEAREDFGRLFFLTARVEPAGPECASNC